MTTGHRPDIPSGVRAARGGLVRTTLVVGETTNCGPSPTRKDSVRTTSDNRCPDTPVRVRTEYRARVPRHMVNAAFAEALNAVTREAHPPTEGPTDDH